MWHAQMVRGQWVAVFLVLLLTLSLSAGCGNGKESGNGGDVEDPYPDSQRVVLVEMFTQSRCPACGPVASDLEQLARDYTSSKAILLEYYLNVASAINGRFNEYEVKYTPTVCFNGPQNADGPASYDQYKSRVDSERAKGSAITITAEKSVSDSKVDIQAVVYNNTSNTLDDSTMWFAVYEDYGSTKLHNVVQGLKSGGVVNGLSSGISESFSQSFDLPDSDMSNVVVVVFLQDYESPSWEILQATLA